MPPKGGLWTASIIRRAAPAIRHRCACGARLAGQPVAQEFPAGGPGRVFLTPSILFYDDEGTPYLVTFRDPWAEETPDGSRRTGQATPEQLQQVACELIAVGQRPASAIPAPPGHTVADCSTAEVWSRAIGRRLRVPWDS